MRWWTVVLVSLLAGVACSSDAPTLERRGAATPPPTTDPIDVMPATGGATGGETAEGGAHEGGQAAAGGSIGEAPPVEFCAALSVVRAKCQRCHTQPPENGAPVPFLTYEDLQAPYGSSGATYAEVAIRAVELDIMPYVVLNDPPSSLMPPVQPLTTEEKATLLTWLEQGALPEGGTDCP